MSSPDKSEARAMVNVFDSEGNRVTGDLKPGDYNLVLETENLIAAVGPHAYIALVLHLTIDSNDTVSVIKEKVVPSEDAENAELPFSVDKWVGKISAIAMLYVGDEVNQGHMFWMDELEKKITSHFSSRRSE